MLKCWRIKHTQFIWREKEKVPAKLYSTKSLLSAFKIMKGLVLCKFAIDFLQLLSQQLIKPIFLEKPKLVNAGKLFRNYFEISFQSSFSEKITATRYNSNTYFWNSLSLISAF